PTWVEDIARGIELLLTSEHRGIYHICGGETMSVADIAMRVAQYFQLDTSLIQSVTTEEMKEATPRPLYSPMSVAKAQRELGYSPSPFEVGLQEWQ
ncbi:MAG: sugar nucleotide-binding protein, partial [Bacteroidaceae bacterium]|nr:sugar nucleotide-binding protein [Bacteroidaceae bacterium]